MAEPTLHAHRATSWHMPASLRAPRRRRLSLRLTLYLAFGVLALLGALQFALGLRADAQRVGDAQRVARAGALGARVQQVGREAMVLGMEAGAADAGRTSGAGVAAPARPGARQPLQRALAQARDEARALDTLLVAVPAADPVAAAASIWRGARERLWARADALLGQGPAAADDAAASLATWPREIDAADAAAQALGEALQQTALRHAQALREELVWSTAALLALLAALAVSVVEPSARAVKRHLARLAEQGADVQRLALVAEHTTAVVAVTDPALCVQWANAAFARVSGWVLEDAIGRPLHELLAHPGEDAELRERLQRATQRGQGLRAEWLLRARDGRDFWLDLDLRPVRDAGGALGGFVIVASDVTARVQQQGKLQALWAALPAGVVVQSADGTILDGNRAAERLLGVSLAQMQASGAEAVPWRLLREDGSAMPLREHPSMRSLHSGEPLLSQILGVDRPDGTQRWLHVNTEPQHDPQGRVRGVITCFTDVSESRALQLQLHDHARTDALTQLPNRAVVMERLQHAVQHAARHPGYGFALLFMDFDRFKLVNDTRGHGAGDELLRQIAERLKDVLRPGDAVARIEGDEHIAARIGGDEFVVVLDGIGSPEEVAAIATRLLDELAQPYVVGAAPLESSASIGVVLYTHARAGRHADLDPGAQAEELLRNADTAMYEAKRAGRGRWVLFDDSMHERVVRAMALETELRQALKADELLVVYQPVVDLATRAMVGVEALVRWAHPVRGLVSPAEFIGVAEECGLIDAVGELVLRKACTQFMQWRRTLGPLAPRQLAVNLSRAQTKRAALVDEVRALLLETGMPPEQLQLEVTESLAAQDERVQGTLRELKNLGVKLALDDFGIGYSSLACLHLLPVDIVKIDRTFVQNAEAKEYHRVLIEATIRVARTLAMTTVAEGIETEGQAALMQRLECDRGQGYLFARPLDATALAAWSRQWQAQGRELLNVG